MDGENISEFLEESEATYSFGSSDDILSILEALDSADSSNQLSSSSSIFEFQKTAAYDSSSPPAFIEISETEVEPPKCKRQRPNSHDHWELELAGGHQKMSHIAVERNRRKQMNHHLSVLRSLMPCFYVKRGDQASIIGGVINYINELQQVMQSLEAKKQRKAYSTTSHEHPPHVLSPRVVVMQMSSPNSLSPRKPPLSPRLPISPRTPSTPMLHNLQTYINSPLSPSPCTSASNSSNDTVNELVATSRSPIADVEVKFCGPNLILKTVSHRIPGQVVKILSALQDLALEILQVNINTLDQRMLNSFTIKIGIECQLSAEELAQQIQRTFS